jgi:hypothetical protein
VWRAQPSTKNPNRAIEWEVWRAQPSTKNPNRALVQPDHKVRQTE